MCVQLPEDSADVRSIAGGFSRCAFNCRRLHLSELELQLQLPEASADVRSIAGGFSLRIED